MNKDSTTNKSLNSFRAIAFFVVFLFHINLLDCGYLGVQAFFVLSGFLITPILVEMKSKMNFTKYWTRFMGRRFLRIFPIYYLLLLVLFLFGCFYGYNKISFADSFNSQLIYAVTYTYNFINAADNFERNSLIAHLWSLAVEEQFYIVWPFFVYFVSANKLKKWLAFIVLLGPIIRILIAICISIGLFNGIISPSNVALPIYVLPFSYFDAFAIGGFFSLFVTYNVRIRWIGLLSLIIITIGFSIEYFLHNSINFSGLGYLPVLEDAYKYIWAYSLFNLVFALILFKMKNRAFFPKIFENNVLNYFGKISYGLYLYHFPVITFSTHFLFHGIDSVSSMISSLIFTVLISIASYHCIELKLLGLKDKFFPR